ncbi:MAG: toll/interleukin-1 receptor domain-containing protein [Chloroflexi bacterium]|nr:toll/interleukin-1 receptor domain-containing protein [Chloroflexota bacterium]
MANEEHVRLVRQGAEALSRWRKQHPGEVLDLSRADLSRGDLSRADLSGGQLVEAGFIRARVTRADFSGANLTGADFFGADLRGADLSGTDLTRSNLSTADLSRANLFEALLLGANLRGANLSGACLTGVDLRAADLSSADLSGASLLGADLTGVDLFGARLLWADLSGARLGRANLLWADLSGAHLTRAELAGANLSHARCMNTVFANSDLRQCRGLESVVHLGPSSIDASTLLQSGAIIPRTFLAGAGLSPDVVETLLRLAADGRRPLRCFISHTSADERFTARLQKDLEDKGVPCWRYDEDILPARPKWADFERAIQNGDKVVAICSRESLEGEGVPLEIERALEMEAELKAESMRRREEAKRQGIETRPLDEEVLIPLRLDGFVLQEWQHGRKADVLARNVLDFSRWQDEATYQAAFRRLLHSLDPVTWPL